jgi:hypothetical protein
MFSGLLFILLIWISFSNSEIQTSFLVLSN